MLLCVLGKEVGGGGVHNVEGGGGKYVYNFDRQQRTANILLKCVCHTYQENGKWLKNVAFSAIVFRSVSTSRQLFIVYC